MAKIEYMVERKESIELPNCFCGEEPELVEGFDEVEYFRYRYVLIQCPYCLAHANDGCGWGTSRSYSEAVEEAAEDWIKMVNRRKRQ